MSTIDERADILVGGVRLALAPHIKGAKAIQENALHVFFPQDGQEPRWHSGENTFHQAMWEACGGDYSKMSHSWNGIRTTASISNLVRHIVKRGMVTQRIPAGEAIDCAGCSTYLSLQRGFRYCLHVYSRGDCVPTREFRRMTTGRDSEYVDTDGLYYDRRFEGRWPREANPADVLTKRIHSCWKGWQRGIWAVEEVEAYIRKHEAEAAIESGEAE